MLWLPALDIDGRPRRLPLADWSTPALAALLVDGACRDAVAATREALAADPPLALWALVRAARLGCGELKTLDALAEWLARNAPLVLRWPEGAAATPSDSEWRKRYELLWSQSLAVAEWAADTAPESSLADPAYLLGLVHAAECWFQLDEGGDGSSGATKVQAALPSWLAVALDQVTRQLPEVSDVVRCMLSARQAVATGERLKNNQPTRSSAGEQALALSLPKLSAALSRLAELRHHFDERLETEKLEAMAEFAAGAGHEINNPLAVIAGRAQLLIADETNAERRRELAVMNSQAMRVFEMISDMMLFARPPKPQLAPCNITTIIDQVLAELAAKIAERNITIERAGVREGVELNVDAVQLSVALRALLDNALNAMGRGGTLTVGLEMRSNESGGSDEAIVSIRDTGPGIITEARRHLFDPFYSGRRAGRGLGMGLAKCWRIVTNHGGTIDVETEAGQGTTFKIRLPISPAIIAPARHSS